MSDDTQQPTVGETDLESAIDAAAEAVAVQAAEIGEIDGALDATAFIGMDALLGSPCG